MSQNLDFPIWSHSGQTGPIHHNITIQPKSAVPGSTWIVQFKIEAPMGWILKKGLLTKNPLVSNLASEAIFTSFQSGPWTFQIEYQGDLPPFGPGPQMETFWETPNGPASILIDPGLTITSTRETSAVTQPPTPLPIAAPILVALVLVLMGIQIWLRRLPNFRMRRWAQRTWAKRPQANSSWTVWETWLNDSAASARKQLPDVAKAREWTSLLDEARFGVPFNETWQAIQNGMPGS